MLATSRGHFPSYVDSHGGRHYTKKKLIKQNRGQILRFCNLPFEAQLSIAHYMGVDGAAWDFSEDGVYNGIKDWHNETDYKEIFEYNARCYVKNLTIAMPRIIERYGEMKFGMVYVPTNEIIKEIWEIDPDIHDDFPDFLSYHQWYTKETQECREWYGNATWYCIISGFNDQLFEDGYHRFHNYVKQGVQAIPCVWYPTTGKKIYDN